MSENVCTLNGLAERFASDVLSVTLGGVDKKYKNRELANQQVNYYIVYVKWIPINFLQLIITDDLLQFINDYLGNLTNIKFQHDVTETCSFMIGINSCCRSLRIRLVCDCPAVNELIFAMRILVSLDKITELRIDIVTRTRKECEDMGYILANLGKLAILHKLECGFWKNISVSQSFIFGLRQCHSLKELSLRKIFTTPVILMEILESIPLSVHTLELWQLDIDDRMVNLICHKLPHLRNLSLAKLPKLSSSGIHKLLYSLCLLESFYCTIPVSSLLLRPLTNVQLLPRLENVTMVTTTNTPGAFERLPLSDKRAVVGERVVLECQVEGHPYPAVKWLKDGNNVSNCPDYEIEEDGHYHRLIMSQVQGADSGRFTAQAANAAGLKQSTCILIVAPAPTPIPGAKNIAVCSPAPPQTPVGPSAPIFLKELRHQPLKPGGLMVMEARVAGDICFY
uniref:Ig-like domain-containing protein n=1 Tax=Heterorhabditis bacteriophora TaxID=37862 RepID=A0A1I7XKU6_HETBA